MTREHNDVNDAMRSQADVTSDNFWEKREAYRAWLYQRAWHDLRWYSVGSLVVWLMLRLFLSGAVLPAAAFGWLVILDARFADGKLLSAGGLTWETAWVFYSVSVPLFFVAGWVVRPWQSPAARMIAREMERWWDWHGGKLPGLKQAAMSEDNKA